MKITTRMNKTIEVREKDIVTLPEGVVGFEEYQRYVFLANPEEEPFIWLQCVDQPEVAFVLIDPMVIDSNYDFEVDDDTIELLDLSDPKNIRLYAIVTVKPDPSKMTANLLAPILLNKANQRARQLVLHQSTFSTRHPIFGGSPEE